MKRRKAMKERRWRERARLRVAHDIMCCVLIQEPHVDACWDESVDLIYILKDQRSSMNESMLEPVQ